MLIINMAKYNLDAFALIRIINYQLLEVFKQKKSGLESGLCEAIYMLYFFFTNISAYLILHIPNTRYIITRFIAILQK